MKKFLLLVFPLAFCIGFMPFFFTNDDTTITSSAPKIIEENSYEMEDEKLNINVKKVIDIVNINSYYLDIIENAIILTTQGIECI